MAWMMAAEPKSTPGETSAKGVTGEGLAGFGQGALRVGPVKLRLLLDLNQVNGGSITGTMDSIDQGGKQLLVTSVAQTGQRVRININKNRRCV